MTCDMHKFKEAKMTKAPDREIDQTEPRVKPATLGKFKSGDQIEIPEGTGEIIIDGGVVSPTTAILHGGTVKP